MRLRGGRDVGGHRRGCRVRVAGFRLVGVDRASRSLALRRTRYDTFTIDDGTLRLILPRGIIVDHRLFVGTHDRRAALCAGTIRIGLFTFIALAYRTRIDDR